jgi:hypothetical protein
MISSKFVVTEFNGSQERLIKSKLNPNREAIADKSEVFAHFLFLRANGSSLLDNYVCVIKGFGKRQIQNYFTDDASLGVFMQSLIKLAVASNN